MPEGLTQQEQLKETLKYAGFSLFAARQGSLFSGHMPAGSQTLIYQDKGHRFIALMNLSLCLDQLNSQRAEKLNNGTIDATEAARDLSMKDAWLRLELVTISPTGCQYLFLYMS